MDKNRSSAEMVVSSSYNMPVYLDLGLSVASKKYDIPKADIVRSLVYDFLKDTGIIEGSSELDSPEDVIIGEE